MNNYCFSNKKTKELLNKIKKELKSNESMIKKASEIDHKDWEFKIDFDKLLNEIDSVLNKEYLPKFSKEKVIDGLGKIALLCDQNPYLILNFIISAIYTNNKVEVVLEDKMIATNKAILESIKKCLSDNKIDEDTVTYIELVNKDDIISTQDKYDLIYYFGNKHTYLNFIKRIHIDSKFEENGEIYIYVDSKDFKEQIVEIDKWAYLNDIKVNLFNKDIDEAIKEINSLNMINKMTIIFSKDIDKVTKFVKKVKSECIYVNVNGTDNYRYETNLEKLIYKKKIIW